VNSGDTGRVAKHRDQRLDVIRGAALLLIVSSHIRSNALPVATGHFGFSDMAEVLVFVSGYVGGLVYLRKLSCHGLWRCQQMAFRRCGEIFSCLAIGQFSLMLCASVTSNFFVTARLGTSDLLFNKLFGDPAGFFLELLTLSAPCDNLSILQLYIVFLLPLPLLVLSRKYMCWPLLIAACMVYLSVQIWPNTVTLPPPWRHTWAFNPLAWQFLFVIGVVLGSRDDLGDRQCWQSWTVRLAAILVLELSLVCRFFNPAFLSEWYQKSTFGPLRLLHFLSLAVFIATTFPRESFLWRTRLAATVAVCGRNPLPTFCVGVLLSLIASLVLSGHDRMSLHVLANFLGWCGCLLTAWFCDRISTRSRREATIVSATQLMTDAIQVHSTKVQ
jgi:hypothetical protein